MPRYLDLDPALLPGFSLVMLPDATESTNALAQQLLQQDAESRRSLGALSVVATGEQTAGRGRLDRSWVVPAGTAVSASFIVRPHADLSHKIPVESYHWITLLLALAAVQALEKLSGVKAGIKWPNDVLLGDQKICGILAQLVAEPDGNFSLVAGIGTNINLTADGLPVETATSLLVATGQEHDLNEYLRLLSLAFAQQLKGFLDVGGDPSKQQSSGMSMLENIREHMVTLGQQVSVHLPDGNITNGRAIDINKDGEILVQVADGSIENFAVGDVVHLRPQS